MKLYLAKSQKQKQDCYAIRAIFPRPERRGLSRTGSLLNMLIALMLWVGISQAADTSVTSAATIPSDTLQSNDGCVQDYDPNRDYFHDKATLAHAQGFRIEYFKHYKVLTVTAPWPDAKEQFRYVLVQCGTPIPAGLTAAQVIKIPVNTIAMLSTTHLPHLEILGAVNRLVAVSGHHNVYSPVVHQLIADGKVAEVGRGPSANMEMLLNLRPDLVTAVGHDQPQYNTHPLLQNAGIRVVINAEYVESTALGRSEWLKFTAAFLNQDGVAERYFADVVQRYEALAAPLRNLPAEKKPSVFGGALQGDVWYAPGGASYVARLVADAGGNYVWAADRNQVNIPLSFEVAFAQAADAQIWFVGNVDWLKRNDVRAANPRYEAFRAFREQQIYNGNARLNQNQANGYWEGGIAEPDAVLADVIKILHPDRLPDHQLKYYRRLP